MKLQRTHAAAVVFLIALAVYLPALRNGFAYDDVAIVQRDARVHTLANAPTFFMKGYWADTQLALYRPLTTLSFALDWAISGGAPAWFLFVNALWHAAVCVLVLAFLARFATVPAAFAGALLFAVHPVHVEAVANVVGRAEVIAAAFMLGAVLLWPRTDRTSSLGRVTTVALLFALALLTKESAIMLPALLVLVDAARGDLSPANIAEWLRRRAPQMLLLVLIVVAYLGVRAYVLGGIAPSRVDAALEVTSGADRIMTALQAWPLYLRLLFVPVVLLADYGPRILMPATRLSPAVAAGALILAATVIGGIIMWVRGRGTAALALVWFPVAILPVSNLLIPIGIIVAERTLYLPSIALCLGAAALLDVVVRRSGATRTAGVAALTIIACLFAARTLIRIPDWRSTDTIFAALLSDRPDSFRAHWHHARLAAVAGDRQKALQLYAHAMKLWPYRPKLVAETSRAALRAGNISYALDMARFGYSRWPDNPEAAHLYAAATLDVGDTTAARAIIADALTHLPGDSLLLRMRRAVSGSDGR